MPGVSKEQIARAKEVNILDYILRHEPQNFKKVGNRYVMREHDSFVISKGKWVWNSQGFGAKQATALNYLVKYHGYSFVDAVRQLAGEDSAPMSDKSGSNLLPVPTSEKQPFSLPPRNQNNDRVIAYLLSRGIDSESIDACISAGILYESVKTHNCVFVGKNEDGQTRFACYRGTSGRFMYDAKSSDKRCGFLLQPLLPENYNKAMCFEAPIDALSHQSLYKSGYTDFDGWRLALGGDSIVALDHFLVFHPFVDLCIASTDSDEAGVMVAAKIMALADDSRFFHVRVDRITPPFGKDWSDTIMEIRRQERQPDIIRTDITVQLR
jgi:hypothetical protein